MPPHDECLKQKEWGAQEVVNKTFKEHITGSAGWRITIIGIAITIVTQTITFAKKWGSQETTIEFLKENQTSLQKNLEVLQKIALFKGLPQNERLP